MDIASVYNADLMAADLQLSDGLLVEDDGLYTAVVLSLFSDARARPDDILPDGDGSRRGWWGDHTPPVVDGVAATGDRFGSRLWLLNREKQMPEVLVRARAYASEALQWLVDDHIAERIEVEAFILHDGVLGLSVAIFRPAADPARYRFDHVWRVA